MTYRLRTNRSVGIPSEDIASPTSVKTAPLGQVIQLALHYDLGILCFVNESLALDSIHLPSARWNVYPGAFLIMLWPRGRGQCRAYIDHIRVETRNESSLALSERNTELFPASRIGDRVPARPPDISNHELGPPKCESLPGTCLGPRSAHFCVGTAVGEARI